MCRWTRLGLATALTIPDTARRMDQRVVFLLSLAAFTSAASLRATDPLLALIAGEFGVTAGTAGAVMSRMAAVASNDVSVPASHVRSALAHARATIP